MIAAESSLNDGANRVKCNILEGAKSENIALEDSNLVVTWEEHIVNGTIIWAYMVLAPITRVAKVEYAMRIQLKPNNDHSGYASTHNYTYTWYTMQCFDHEAQLRKVIQHQHRFLSSRRFLIVNGFQSQQHYVAIPSQTQLAGGKSEENTTPIASLLLTATNLFNNNGSNIRTLFLQNPRHVKWSRILYTV